ncbi:restriction endonuclease subunit S [Helicobacter felis]|uniref:restriction endonuclease subunit S n=1 Tax=Helicobacter felis TaxID=214 RepID=UPI000CF19819|nr:restriction endonuclease subunit S [Helicobacter felis]
MITKDNLKEVLQVLNFTQEEETYTHAYANGAKIMVDFKAQTIDYSPQDPNFKEGDYPSKTNPSTGFIIHRNTTTNFSSNENFVCLVAVHKLLEKGYAPKHIILEPTFKVGHGQKAYGDILVLDQEFKPLVLIENKTYGEEFNKEWENMLKNGGQLFSYYAVHKVPYLCILAFGFEAPTLLTEKHIIYTKDNEDYLRLINAKRKPQEQKRGFGNENNSNVEDYYRVWSETYQCESMDLGLFGKNIEPYHIGQKRYTLSDLEVVPYEKISTIYHKFATILRHHSIGNYENSFYILVDLFLCKVMDELQNEGKDEEEQSLDFYYKGPAADSPLKYCDRLLDLYAKGVEELFKKKVVNVKKEEIAKLFDTAKRYKGKFKKDLDALFDQQKYFNIKKFNFIEIENEEEFQLNFKILVQVADLIKKFYICKSENNQFLGDLFEGFLNRHIHQTEGRFFTPTPITNFIIHSLPPLTSNPKVLDFACGAGHFLTEFMARHKDAKVYGIEKNKDLSKVAKLACIFHNPKSPSLIIFQDALDHIHHTHSQEFEMESFDYILSNPPYSVKGFLSTLDSSVIKSYELHHSVEEKSYESNNAIECFFIERAWHFLKEGGVFALILPVSVLQKGGIYEKTRTLLLEHFKILCIVELNSRTFGSTGTQTIILCAQKLKKYSADLIEALQEVGFENADLKKDFAQNALLNAYCAFRGYPQEDFKVFLKEQSLSLALEKSFKEYFDDFNAKEPKVFKKAIPTKSQQNAWFEASSPQDKRAYKAELERYLKSETYQESLKAWQREQVLAQIHALELEKMLLFASVQEEEVLILKSPSEKKGNASNKAKIVEFLGYDWSKRKGDEGIKYTSTQTEDLESEALGNIQSVKHIVTPLYNPSNPDDPSKLAYALKSFMGSILTNTPRPNLSRYTDQDPNGYQLFSTPLSGLIDFSKSVLDRAISLTPKHTRQQITSAYPIVKLETCGKFLMGGTPSRKNPQYWNGTIKWLTIGDYAEYQSITDTKERITEAGLQASNVKLVPKGAVVVSIYATIGRVGILEGEMTTNQAIVSIIPNQDFRARYLMYAIGCYKFQLLDEVITTSQKNINLGILQNMRIPKPPLPVQEQIIAACAKVEKRTKQVQEGIQSYQNLILAVLGVCGVAKDPKTPPIEQILKTLATLKLELEPTDPKLEELKSLVQDLPNPPAEGWEMVKLGIIVDIQSGGTPNRKIPAYWNGNINWLRSEACQNCYIYENQVKEKITELGLHKSSAKMFKKDSVLIALVGATIGKVGYLTFESTTNQNIAGLYPLDSCVLNSRFLYFATLGLYPQFKQLGDFAMANLSFIRDLKIPLPPLPMQEQIASILSQIEQEIARLDQEIATLEGQEQEILQEFLGKERERERERERSQNLKIILDKLERAKALKESYLALLTHALEKAGLKPTLATLLQSLPTPPTSGWDLVKLGAVCQILIGGTPSRKKPEYFKGTHLWVSIAEMDGQVITNTKEKITDEAIKVSNVKLIPKGTTLLSFKLSIGKVALAGKDLYTNEAIAGLIPKDNQVLDRFLFVLFRGRAVNLDLKGNNAFGKSLNSQTLNDEVKIPLPPLPVQEQIVSVIAKIEQERTALENAMKSLGGQQEATLKKYLNPDM